MTTKCTFPLCVFFLGHAGPHGMNPLDYRPELPKPSAEEDQIILKLLKLELN